MMVEKTRLKKGHNPTQFSKGNSIGWKPTCKCQDEIVPCVVIDPFAGSGTTGVVASRIGLDAILIDLNTEYVSLMQKRLQETDSMFTEIIIK